MTDQTISQLTDGGTVQTTDQIPVTRSGSNRRVAIGSAGTKAASDATKDKVASVDGSTTPGHMAVFSDDDGTVEDGGLPSAIITGATLITPPVLTTDYVPIVRGGQIYLTTVEELLNAQAPAGEGGQFDFSDSQNSAYAAII
jgi:hypothetical protein